MNGGSNLLGFVSEKNSFFRILFAFFLLLSISPVFAKKLSMEEAKSAGDSIVPAEILPFWKSLTLKEKAAQTLMVYMPSANYIQKHRFGGVLIMKPHLKDTLHLMQTLQSANDSLKLPLLVAIDQEGGRVNRLQAVSKEWQHLPSAKEMREMNVDSVYELAKQIGMALHRYGINLNLAPVLDPPMDSKNKPSFMELSHRSFGDFEKTTPKIKAFVQGMKESNVLSTSKHFPGYDSWTNSDHQIAFSTSPKEVVQKNAEFFKSFSEEIPVIMLSSVRFVRFSNTPAVFNPRITKMARENSPYTVLLTDDLWGVSLRAWIAGKDKVKGKKYPAKDFRKLIRTVLWAGNDMFMITYPAKAVEMISYLEQLGSKFPEYRLRIEQAAARIVRLKYLSGIWKENSL